MDLFVCENYKGEKTGTSKTDELIKKSLQAFCGIRDAKILRTDKGKPYFDRLPGGVDIEFSVSHTGDIWVCLMTDSGSPVGVDVQLIKEYDYEKIATRYYMEEEREYTARNGVSGFFDIWVCKEAYAKYTGEGLGKTLKHVATIPGREYGNDIKFVSFDIKEGIKGACCVKNTEGELWIRKI